MKNFLFIGLILTGKLVAAAPSAAIWYGNSYDEQKKFSFSKLLLGPSSTEARTCVVNSNQNVYVGGMGYFQKQSDFYASLWFLKSLNSKSSAPFPVSLNGVAGSRISGSALGNTKCYFVGPPDTVQYDSYQPNATLYIANATGTSSTEILLSTNESYAYGCCFENNKVYSVGWDSHPKLWITDENGNGLNSVQLSNNDTGASNCAIIGQKCYVVGQDLFPDGTGSSYYLAALYSTDLDGNSLQGPLNLESGFPPNVDDNSYATSCSLCTQNNKLFISGGKQLTNDSSYSFQPCLWIVDVSNPSNLKISSTILLKNDYNADVANGIAIFGNYCYIVGGSSVWVYDLNGNCKQVLKLPDASDLWSVYVSQNNIYISGNSTAGSSGAVQTKLKGASSSYYQR